MVIVALPFCVVIFLAGVAAPAPAAAVVSVVVVVAAGTVTDEENAFELSPTDRVIVPELEPVVIVHVNAFVVPAETVSVFVSAHDESPLAEYPEGQVNL